MVTFRVFSLVFFSSNLEKGPSEAWPCCRCGATADCGWDCVCAPWLLAYAASSSRCSLEFTVYTANAFDKSNSSLFTQENFILCLAPLHAGKLLLNFLQEVKVLGRTVLLFCQGPVILDLFLPYPLVLLPPALGAQALPCGVAIVTTSLFAQQVRLVNVYPPPLRPLTHDLR